MARLIDADKIVNGIALYMTENAYLNDTPLDALKMVANWITDAPTVDAVELVRCRDCKYRVLDWQIKSYYCSHPNGLCGEMDGTRYCDCGKRKDGDGNG